MPSDELSSNDSAVIDDDLVQALGFEPAPDDEISVVEDDAADLVDEPPAAAIDLDDPVLEKTALDTTVATDDSAQLASELGFDAVVENDDLELDLDANPDAAVEEVAEGMLDEVVEGETDPALDDSGSSGIASFFATRTESDADTAKDDADVDLSSLPIVDDLADSDFDGATDSALGVEPGALDSDELDVLDLDSVPDLVDETALKEAATDDVAVSEIELDDLPVDDAEFDLDSDPDLDGALTDEPANLAPDELDVEDEAIGPIHDEIDQVEVLDVDAEDLELGEPELFDQADDGVSTEPAPLIDLTGDAAAEAPTSFLDPVDVPDLDPLEAPVGAPSPDGLVEGLVDDGAVVASPTEVRKRGRGSRRHKQVRARKARRVVRHVDPWSVLTFSVLFHLCFFAAMLLASVLVWNAALASGTLENIENFITELGDYESFEINGDVVFRSAVIVAGMLTLASSVLVVLLTVVFNLISDLIGGIRITVIEEETVRVPAKSK